jgi:hypothetical protein
MYTKKNFKTKKELKDAVAAYNLRIAEGKTNEQGVVWALGVEYFQPGPFGGNAQQNGTFCCEGPHYPAPHSWYATCTAKDGVIVKVK